FFRNIAAVLADDPASRFFGRRTGTRESSGSFGTDDYIFMGLAEPDNIFITVVPAIIFTIMAQQSSAYYIHNYSFRVTTVTPSPPSSYFPFRKEATSLWFLNARRRPSLSIPSPRPWMTVTSLRPAM